MPGHVKFSISPYRGDEGFGLNGPVLRGNSQQAHQGDRQRVDPFAEIAEFAFWI